MKLKIEVGEPRNFDAGNGTNVIIATVVEGLGGSRTVSTGEIERFVQVPGREQKVDKVTEYWVVANCSPVKFEDMEFSSVLMVPRYRTKRPPLEIIQDGEKLVFNCVWRADGGQWDKKSVEEAVKGEFEISGLLVANVTEYKE